AGWGEQFVRPRRHLQSEQSGATGGLLCRTGGFSNTSSSLWPRLAARWVCTRRARSRIRRATSPSSLPSRRAASPIRWRASSAKAWASGWGARSSIENRGGAGGNIAAAAVARAAPDGYTLLVTTTAVAINETLRPNKGFAASDLKPIAIVASSPESLVTSPSNPAANLANFLKAEKGKNITFGSAGVGSGSHIAAEYFFKEIAKISATHVPFQGGAPAIAATIGNQIDLLATTLGGGAAAQIASGKLKGLGVASAKRAAVTPNVPTYAEAGYPD